MKHAGALRQLGSTQQLARILFEKLGLTAGRKGKTGYSTDSRVLRGIRADHEIVLIDQGAGFVFGFFAAGVAGGVGCGCGQPVAAVAEHAARITPGAGTPGGDAVEQRCSVIDFHRAVGFGCAGERQRAAAGLPVLLGQLIEHRQRLARFGRFDARLERLRLAAEFL